jgi:hypothetical protein
MVHPLYSIFLNKILLWENWFDFHSVHSLSENNGPVLSSLVFYVHFSPIQYTFV